MEGKGEENMRNMMVKMWGRTDREGKKKDILIEELVRNLVLRKFLGIHKDSSIFISWDSVFLDNSRFVNLTRTLTQRQCSFSLKK